MKKLFILAIAFTSMTLFSCGNKTANNAEICDSTTTTEDSVNSVANALTSDIQSQLESKDATKVQTAIAAAQAKFTELVKAGKTEEAKVYASKIKTYITEHAEEIKTATSGNATVSALIDGIKNLPSDASASLTDLQSAVKSDAASAKENVKSAASEAIDNTKKSATESIENKKAEVKAKAKEDVEKVKSKANEEVNKATNKALKGLGL